MKSSDIHKKLKDCEVRINNFPTFMIFNHVIRFSCWENALLHEKEHYNTANLFLRGTKAQCGTEANDSEHSFEPDIATENGIRFFILYLLKMNIHVEKEQGKRRQALD